MSVNVRIEDVVKKYGDFRAVDNVSVDIKEGEFFTLLGPSGCGKTTLLRMIAGFNSIDGGAIYFGDTKINNVAAHTRDIGMVFQNYAIFPHMTIFDNVAYGLKNRKVSKDEIKKRVEKTLEIVQISHLKDRMPAAMSGGQQQRVALARAIVIEPQILLMDEPLSNLDAKLRVQMRTMIQKLQKDLGITTIYVTHDQEEALAVSDRIAIMKDGKIAQLGTPQEVYKKPSNEFVANFIGTSIFVPGDVISQNGSEAEIKIENYSFKTQVKGNAPEKVRVSVRPEQFMFNDKSDEGITGKIIMCTFLGDYWYYEVELSTGQTIEVHEYTKEHESSRCANDNIKVVFDLPKINIFNAEGTEAIR